MSRNNRNYENHSLATRGDTHGGRSLAAILKALGITGDYLLNVAPYGTDGAAFGPILLEMPMRDYLAEAADAMDRGENPEDLLALYVGSLHRGAVAKQVAEIRNQRTLGAIDNHADDIILALRAKVFEPTMKRLRAVFEQSGATLDVQAAAKSKDWRRAENLDRALQDLHALSQAHRARQLLHGNAFEGPAAWFLEPSAIGLNPMEDRTGQGPQMESLAFWAHAFGENFTPHFPTLGEYLALRNSTQHREATELGSSATFSPEVRGLR